MCCRVVVRPIQPDIAMAVLAIGQFVQRDGQQNAWVRSIPDEATQVTATIRTDELELALSPSVSTMDDHHNKRRAAGVMFEIAAKYAEKVGGMVQQKAINVAGCQESGHERLLASYPSQPLDFRRICPGWQLEFTNEHD